MNKIIGSLLCSAAVFVGRADVFSWIGSTGSCDWNVATNWSSGTVPTGDATVVFPCDYSTYSQKLVFRLAPSAVNKQPWRVLKAGHMVHFYLKRGKGFSGGRLDMQKGLAEYSCMSAGARIPLRRDIIKNIREYKQVLSDPRVRDIPCPDCQAVMKPQEWLSFGGGRKSVIARCEQHGQFLVKLSCKKASETLWTAARTIYRADEDAIASSDRKLAKQREVIARRKAERTNDDNNSNV